MSAPRLFLQPARIEHDGLVARITPQELTILLALMGRHWMTKSDAADLLWPDADAMPEQWYNPVRVIISTLRTKLRLFGWTIETRYGFGWKLERHAGHNGTAQETAWEAPQGARAA